MDLINRAKKLRVIQAIQQDLDTLGQVPVVQALQRDLGNVGASTRGLVSDVAGDLRRGSEQQMDQVRQREMTRDLIRGNKGAQNVVAETLANADAELFGTVAGQSGKDAYMKQLQAEGLSNLAAGKFARGYVQNTERPQATPRARIQQMLGGIENNPGRAVAAGAGTGAVGGLALITASGQALADLGNFLAGGQQNQDTRDNVLRS